MDTVCCSNLGLKLQGKLTVQVLKATNLKNLEMVGKSDPYVRLYVRVLFKEKTRVIDNNLNPVWNEQFEFDVEDQETQSLILDVRISNPVCDTLSDLVDCWISVCTVNVFCSVRVCRCKLFSSHAVSNWWRN